MDGKEKRKPDDPGDEVSLLGKVISIYTLYFLYSFKAESQSDKKC